MLHWPGWTGHRGSAPAVWQIALVNEQWPSFGHSPGSGPLTLQALPPTLQVPRIVGQMSPRWQVCRVFVLQFPNDEQAPSLVQPRPSREQVPGCTGHSPRSGPETWQTLPTMLQVPTLGQVLASSQFALLLLHFPGGQVVFKVHTGHSSPVHGQTSGGSHAVVQLAGFGGTQVGATRLQTWDLMLLQV